MTFFDDWGDEFESWPDIGDHLPPEGDDPIWITGNGDRIPLSSVDNQHLQNIERFLLGRGACDTGLREILFKNWYETIRTELELRGLPVLGDHPRAHERQEAKMGHLHRIHDDWEGELA